MASFQLDDRTRQLLNSSYGNIDASDSPQGLSRATFPAQTYSPEEEKEISSWISKSSTISPSEANSHLSSRTTVLGSKPSVADVVLYSRLAPQVKAWSDEQKTGKDGHHHVVRFLDYIQHSSDHNLKLAEADKIPVDPDRILSPIPPVDPKAEKERKKKEKEKEAAAAAAAAGESKSLPTRAKEAVSEAKDKVTAAVTPDGTKAAKKEKAAKPGKAPKPAAAPEKPLSPSLIDLRVGHILRAVQHPNADSLYVSTVAVGDPPGTDNTSLDDESGLTVRTVCSGLNGLVPLAEMQGRKVVAVCNLKPVTMRGVKSCAMVLAASPRPGEGGEDAGHGGPVELVEVPPAAEAGDRVAFEGWEGVPDPVLNPKKKVWEMLQPGFTTGEDGVVAFDPDATTAELLKGKAEGRLLVRGQACTVKTLRGAVVR